MTLQDIEEKLKDKPLMSGNIPMTSLATLQEFTNVKLMMDDESYDYYYALDVKKLLESPATAECLNDLSDDGWSLTKDKKYIIKYIKNFT